jgi:hypothetical protein
MMLVQNNVVARYAPLTLRDKRNHRSVRVEMQISAPRRFHSRAVQTAFWCYIHWSRERARFLKIDLEWAPSAAIWRN